MLEEYEFKVPPLNDFSVKYYVKSDDIPQKPKQFPPHIHDSIEAYVLIEGDASFMVENNLYELTAGDVVITKPNEIHNCILNSESVHKHACFWFECSNEFLFGSFLNREFGKDNLISLPQNQRNEFMEIIARLCAATQKGQHIAEFSYALDLIRMLASNVGSVRKSAPMPAVLESVLSEINRDFISVKSVEWLCEKHYLSHSTLCRMFRKYLKTSPKSYLETKRLAYSRILLRQGKSVVDACAESGFSDYSNYIRLFKRRFGITPNKYRDN